MSFFLSKFLLFIIRPLVWILALAILAYFAKKQQIKNRLIVCCIVMLYFFSNKFILGKVAGLYEPKVPNLSHYDVGLLLGGFSSFNESVGRLKSQSSGDRLTQTIRLYHEGKIDKILMSGGKGELFNDNPPEADYTYEYLKAIKIPDSAILIEKESRNTKENFNYATKLLAKEGKLNAKILVITSAWHIPRTKLIAEKQGFKNFEYYPTDALVDSYSFEDYLLPQADAIRGWEALIKEWVGYCTILFHIT